MGGGAFRCDFSATPKNGNGWQSAWPRHRCVEKRTPTRAGGQRGCTERSLGGLTGALDEWGAGEIEAGGTVERDRTRNSGAGRNCGLWLRIRPTGGAAVGLYYAATDKNVCATDRESKSSQYCTLYLQIRIIINIIASGTNRQRILLARRNPFISIPLLYKLKFNITNH